ncbi:MAG: LLM class F420-dependent oxidoreductase, partial [Candidatus Promineifilaceae bacterium]
MKIGVTFPQIEFGSDPAAVKEYAQTAESLGFTHILAYDHILGANPDHYAPWTGPYTYKNSFLEPFVLFSYMAALTESIHFTTGILILPQRQTALVAKQAAVLDKLSNGRFRLGAGIGWNRVEYEALEKDFHTRGRRIEEQITLLRQLWTQPLVTFEGRWESVIEAGLNPLPVQQPIPIWLGGHADAVLRRIARMADGWMTNYRSAELAAPSLEKLDNYLAEAGRSRDDFGLEPRLYYSDGEDIWLKRLEEWRAAGATHITINTMGAGLKTPADHIQAIRNFAEKAG